MAADTIIGAGLAPSPYAELRENYQRVCANYDATLREFAEAQADLAAAREACALAYCTIANMRNENRLHGHITTASAHYEIHVKPKIERALAAAPAEPGDGGHAA